MLSLLKRERRREIRQLEHISGRKITRSGNAKAEITSIELLNLALEESRCFISGERAIIRLVVHFNQSLKSPTYGILIRDRLGIEVFGTNSYYKKIDEFIVDKGLSIEANFEIELNLCPGSYSTAVAVHSGAAHTDENFDWLDNAVVFEVLPNTSDYSIGIAALPCNISLKELTESG